MADEAPEQIIINGQEYTPEEATQFIELGKRAREIESNLNTSLDKVYPNYTRTAQEKKDLAEKLAAAETELEELRKPKVKTELPEDAETIRANARKYGLLTEDVIAEKGYMTKDEVDQYLQQRDVQQKLVEDLNKQGAQLETEIDGSDGRVPFVYKAVLPFAANYKIDDLKEAYEQMNEKANAKWKEAQIAKQTPKGLQTLKPGSMPKEPERPKITDDNLGQMLGELFNGTE